MAKEEKPNVSGNAGSIEYTSFNSNHRHFEQNPRSTRETIMSLVYYQLINVEPLRDFVSAPLAGGGFAPAVNPLPHWGAIYVIINAQRPTLNFYVGVSSDIHNRYNPMAERLHHLGFHQADLNNMAIYCGTVHYWNTNDAYPAPAAMGAGPIVLDGPFGAAAAVHAVVGVLQPNTALIGIGQTVPNYSPNSMTVNIDAVAVDLEALLIRYYMMGSGFGWHNTNTRGQAVITNGRDDDMRVLVRVVNPGVGFGGYGGTLQGTVNDPPNGESW